jgi:hypothetical protein
VFGQILAGGQFKNLPPVDGRIKLPVKLFQCFELPEIRRLRSSAQKPLLAHIEFILEDQFQELAMAQVAGLGLLQAHWQGLA